MRPLSFRGLIAGLSFLIAGLPRDFVTIVPGELYYCGEIDIFESMRIFDDNQSINNSICLWNPNRTTKACTWLQPEDDAAYAALGGKFRTPTKTEIDALLATNSDTENYTWTWCDGSTVKYNGSITPGWKIVKNSSSATLFLPAAGYRNRTDLKYCGSEGYYWSSFLYLDYPISAWYLMFDSKYPFNDYCLERYLGFSVRPVSD